MKNKVKKIIGLMFVFGLVFSSYSNAYAFSNSWSQQHVAPNAVARAYLVDKDNIGGKGCSDTWTGTFEQPLCTIDKGISFLQPGDTLFVRKGTYPSFSVSKSGVVSKYIIISGYNNERPLIIGGQGIQLKGTSYIILRGFEVTGASVSWAGGITVTSSSMSNPFYNIIEDNKVHDNTYANTSGIELSEGSYNRILHNEVYNNYFSGIRVTGTSSLITDNEIGFNTIYNHTLSGGDSDGIDLYGATVTKTYIHDNIVHDNSDDGIDTWNSLNNIVVNNISYNHVGVGDGNGFKMGGTNGGHNIVKNNIAFNNKATGFDSNGSGGNVYYNNVAYNNAGYGFQDAWRESTSCTVSSCPSTFINNIGYNNVRGNFSAGLYTLIAHNNIWYSSDIGASKVAYNYNLYQSLLLFYAASGNRLDNPNAGNLSSLQVNPQFVNPANSQFDLLSLSPAIDHGDPVNPGQSAAISIVDIGAFEYNFSLLSVASVVRTNTDLPSTASVDFTVKFSQAVTGVDSSDFSLITTGISGAAINVVNGSGTTYTVTVNVGSGTGIIRLNVIDDDTIKNIALKPLGGVGAANGNFTGGETYTINKSSNVYIGGVLQGGYFLAVGESTRQNYAGVDNGPVKVVNTDGVPIIAAIRDAWAVNGVTTSFSQLMGLPLSQISDKYVFPAYNNVTLNEQLRIGNVDTVPSTVTVTIGGVLRGTYTLQPNEAVRINYAGLDSGPVIVQGTAGVDIIAAIREAWAVNGVTKSFVQLMGLAAPQLSNKYVFPAYNNITLNEQLRIGNVDTVESTVTVTIGGVLRGTYTLQPNQAVRVNYAGLDSGPVVVEGTVSVDIIAAIRDAWAVNGVTTSFSQLMGMPAGQLSDQYLFPAYNNVTLNEQLRIGNVDTTPTTVTVTIGGVLRGTYPLDPNEAVRINYAGLDSGPVVVQGTAGVDIISAIRDAWAVNGVTQSFVQLMGLPAGHLSATYLFPAYNNVTLNEQLRIGLP